MRRLSQVILLCVLLASAASADGLRWYSVETEHFRFIYRPDHRSAVDELVTYADEVYNEVAAFFGSRPEPIDVVIYGETDLGNGYFSPLPPHIGLYVAHPTLFQVVLRDESWLRTLFIHEVTHYVHLYYRHGLLDALGTLFGRSARGATSIMQPVWWTEGLGVYLESELTSGGRLRNPFFEMEYKAAVIEDRLWTLFQSGYDSSGAPLGRYYNAGAFIVDSLIDRYGEDFVTKTLEDFTSFPFFGIWGPIRRLTGARMLEIYDQIEADLRGRYAEDAAIPAAPRLSPEGRGDYYAPVATERGLYLYRIRPDVRPAIVRFDPQTGEETPLVEVRLPDHASWSVTPDGATIAFASVTTDRTFPSELARDLDIYLHDVATATTRQLTTSGGLHHPAIAPDGERLVAVQRRGSYHRLVLLDLPVAGGEARIKPIVEIPMTRFFTPAFSPSGRSVVAVANQRGDQRLVIIDLEHGEWDVLARPEGDGVPVFPVFLDESTLLYGNDRGGSLALYRHEIGGDRITRVVRDPVGAYAGVMTPQGVAVASYTSDGYTLRLADSASMSRGEPVPAVTPPPFAELEPPAPVDGRAYTPRAAPAFWLPTAGVAGPGLELQGLGIGALIFGANSLGSIAGLPQTTWLTSAVVYPGYSQIDYTVQLSSGFGAWSFAVQSQSTFTVSSTAGTSSKLFSSSASLRWQPIDRFYLDRWTEGYAELSASQSLLFQADQPFVVGDAMSGRAPLGSNRIVPQLTIGGLTYERPAERAAVPPGALSAAVAAAVPFNASGSGPEGLLTALAARYTLGIAATSHVVSVSPQATYATSPEVASALPLRGFAAGTSQETTERRGRARLALDYQTPRALIDLPIHPSAGLTSIGFGAFVEATGSFDPSEGASIDPAIATGMQATAVLTVATASFPVTIGLSVRIDVTNPGSVENDDVRLYVQSDLLQSIPGLP